MTATQTTVEHISVEAVREALDRGDALTIVDVRPREQYDEWRIPGSIHADVYETLKAEDPNAMAGVDLPKDRPVVTVCEAGNTSIPAAEQLAARGFDARSLDGGMRAWSLAWNVAEVPVEGSTATVVQIRRTGKGCLSYIVASGERAVLIDPSVEPEVYVDLARVRGWTIERILETHVHADHLMRSPQIMAETGATLDVLANHRLDYPFHPVQEGDEIAVGDSTIAVMHTPGHTMESAVFVLDGKAAFTGDTLFLDGIGRPDLEASEAELRNHAQALHRSLARLLELPAETAILPGHTNAPIAFDRKPLMATLAEVKQAVDLLGEEEAPFVEAILGRIPETPPNHHQIIAFNEAGDFPVDPTELEAGANRCAIS
jgi:glyoxylase-like metal-dependent hydrolase (beta-lactamase superfamily II)